MKILIAEDEYGFALILRRTLEKHGHDVTVTKNGVEALEALQREEFPLLISDWMMPVMDGPSLCRQIRARENASYTYIILLTSHNEHEYKLEGLESGADDFLAKPLGRGELAARLVIAERILTMQEVLQRSAEEASRLNHSLQQQMRQVTALNAELEQFASIACHDLQEPLRKIQIFSSRLSGQYRDTLGSQGSDIVSSIQRASERMQVLIKDLFALTQVDRVDRPFEVVHLGRIACEVVTDLEGTLEMTGGRVLIEELPTVLGDPSQIRQLLQNLIGNGLKYHRSGVPPVVTLTAVPGVAGIARLEVTDNGIGFEEQYLTRIFAPFQRLHGRGKYEGTGIGLAICRKIMDRHRGTISARSDPGYGATFIVDFRLDSIK